MPSLSEVNSQLKSIAALAGAAGVAAAASATHGGKADLAIAANYLLLHAPALLGIALIPANWVATIAGWVLLAALALFAGDLAMRDVAGTPLFAYAAPIGGVGLIAGWLILALSPWTRR